MPALFYICSPLASDQDIRNFLGGFDFRGDAALEKITRFSGGEKARLALAIIAWQTPNLLMLDEPTNHLDLEMRHALTEALQNFEGAIIVVSHDRHLLKNTVDTFWLVAEGEVEEFKGDLHDYEVWLQNYQPDNGAKLLENKGSKEDFSGAQNESSENKKERKRLAAEKRKKLSPLKKQLAQAETAMANAQKLLATLEEKLADADLYLQENKEKLKTLLDEQTQQKQTLDKVEMKWFELSEEIEDAEQLDD